MNDGKQTDVILLVVLLGAICAFSNADDLLYSFDGDVLPSDPASGLNVFDPCNPPCQESLGNGFFRVSFPPTGTSEQANYHRWIFHSDDEPVPSLWAEWRFRSNHLLPPTSFSCDGSTSLRYLDVHEPMWLYGDRVLSFGLDDEINGLELETFYTLRFESLDGIHYRYAVNGNVFSDYVDDTPGAVGYLQFRSTGGCTFDWIPNKYNEWDFVRYGTIGFGERIVTADPPVGFLNANQFAGLDNFTVTYNSPNFAYVDDISVAVTGGVAPQVIATKRIDNSPPELVQVILDRPLPPGQRTTFTFSDGETTNVVAYTFQHGDIDADGDWDLFDFSGFQNCHFSTGPSCPAYNFAPNGDAIIINALDYILFHAAFTGP